MNVLFVCSGNSDNFKVSPFIQSQGDSLVNNGISLTYFTIQNKGISGYVKAAKQLRIYLKKNRVDIIHAHYTLSAWTAVLSYSKLPIVLSLMGDDAYGTYIAPDKISFKSRFSILLSYLIQPFVQKIICKSKHIQSFVLNKDKSEVIPNGILFEDIPLSQDDFCNELSLSKDKQYVLFMGNKQDVRKNYRLIQDAIEHITTPYVEVIAPYPIDHQTVLKYMQSVDVLVLPSFMEGSPNVVKEAMACNCPVVATDVGDVAWLFGDEPGYFLTDFNPETCAQQIDKALAFSKEKGKTKGRQRLMELGLESSEVAKKIIALYKEIIRKT